MKNAKLRVAAVAIASLAATAALAQDAHDRCVQGCELHEKQCMDTAHDSAERQVCVREVEACRAACPAAPPPLVDDYCLDKTVAAPQSSPKHGFSNGIEINPDNDHAWTNTCMPPVLQAVQATSFSIVFKVHDADLNIDGHTHKVRIALYENNEGTFTPTKFWTVVPKPCTGYLDNSTTDSPTGCYEKHSFTGLTPGHTYHYNLNVDGQGTCGGSSCDTCSHDCGITGGRWFDKRREAQTAPKPVAHGSSPVRILVLGDSRDGDQDGCKGGEWQQLPGSNMDPKRICGGSGPERDAYGKAIADFAASFHTNLVVHGGDIAGSDGFKETLSYWAILGLWWRDISTGFAFGNHEFATPRKKTNLREQEILGSTDDTKADDMIVVPEKPVSLGGIAYPAPGDTFYSQTYGNVHVVYVNAQLCPLDGFGTHFDGGCMPKDKDHGIDASQVFETHDHQPCNCFDQATAQREWLKKDLKAANNDKQVSWIVVSHHKAIWSNGPTDSTAGGEWTNTIGKLEWHAGDSQVPLDLNAPSQPATADNLIPLDALYQMFNVDLVLSSHAHYYEMIKDERHRASGDALPHMLIGGSAAAEQLYQCPQAANCDVTTALNPSASLPVMRLPTRVIFERAKDGVFAFGDLHFEGDTMKRAAFSLTPTAGIPQVTLKRDEIGGTVLMTSRKSQILKGGKAETFNGCNLVYPFPQTISQLPTVQKNVNCTVQ